MAEERAAVAGSADASVTTEQAFDEALEQLVTEWEESTSDERGTDVGAEGTAAQTTQAARPEDTLDYWKSLAAQREQEFRGLQGTVQKLTEAERRREQIEVDSAERRFQESLAYMTDDQKALALSIRRVAEREQELEARGRMVQQAFQVANSGSRSLVTRIIAERYGVNETDLADCESPQEMERVGAKLKARAEHLDSARREARREERAESGADAFGRGGLAGGGSGGFEEPKTDQEAEELLVRLLSRRR